MSLNIIIKSGKSEDERLSQDNAKKILRQEYNTECREGSGSHDQRDFSKAQIRRAWEEDSKGNDDPHFRRYDEIQKRIQDQEDK